MQQFLKSNAIPVTVLALLTGTLAILFFQLVQYNKEWDHNFAKRLQRYIDAASVLNQLSLEETKYIIPSLNSNYMRVELSNAPKYNIRIWPEDNNIKLAVIENPNDPIHYRPSSIHAVSDLIIQQPTYHKKASIYLSEGKWLSLHYSRPFYNYPVNPAMIALIIAFIVQCIAIFSIYLYRKNYMSFSKPLLQLKKGIEDLAPNTITPLSSSGPNTVREATQAINKLQSRIVSLTKERDIFFAALSHDIKTPLTRLRLRIEKTQDPQEREKMFRNIEEIGHLLEEMLTFVKYQYHKEAFKPVDIISLLKTICYEYEDLKKDVSMLDMHITGARILGQPQMLARAFNNLIANAIKYGYSAKIHIQQQDGFIQVCIDDKGPGLSEDELSKVFSLFYRSSRHSGQHLSGTGLGLSIAKSIFEKHQGTIGLSNLAGGMRVTVNLPLHETAPILHEESSPSHSLESQFAAL